MDKVWGKKIDLFNTKRLDVDLLVLKPNTFCSFHYHEYKGNLFILLWGKVFLDFYSAKTSNRQSSLILIKNIASIIIHRFRVIKPSLMIEISYVKKGILKLEDIVRLKQGGVIVDGKKITETDFEINKNVYS